MGAGGWREGESGPAACQEEQQRWRRGGRGAILLVSACAAVEEEDSANSAEPADRCPGLTRAQAAVPALDQHRVRRRVLAREARSPIPLRIRILFTSGKAVRQWRRTRWRVRVGIAAILRCYCRGRVSGRMVRKQRLQHALLTGAMSRWRIEGLLWGGALVRFCAAVSVRSLQSSFGVRRRGVFESLVLQDGSLHHESRKIYLRVAENLRH